MFYFAALAVLAVDLLIKFLVSTRLAPAGSVPVIKGLFALTYVQNSGVAFGLFPHMRLLLVFTGIAICALVIYFHAKINKENIYLQFCLAIILGGSLGNLFDRIFLGYVVDYLDLRVFAVFNFADVAINFGVFLIIIDFLFKRDKCIR